jgi:homoprotocatechuate degradation regulator HpaR
MTGEFDHRNLPMLLLQARESVMSMFRPVLKQFSLTEQQWRIVRALNDHPHQEMEAGQIAKICCILSPSLTGVLERMERDRMIRRARVASDQRKVIVSLTPQSHALVEEISPIIDEQYRLLERKIGVKTLAQAYRLLDTLIETLPGDDPASANGAAQSSGAVRRAASAQD